MADELDSKTYFCSDEEGKKPIEHVYIFSVKYNQNYSVTSNPTEMGTVRQDNVVRQPSTVQVRAIVNAPDGSDSGDSDWKDRDGEEWASVFEYFANTFQLISIIDHGALMSYLMVTNVSATHDTSMPDCVLLDISLVQILDANSLTESSSSGS